LDQPDLKATYELIVIAPAEWEVVTSGIPDGTQREADGRVVHRFAPTAPFSPYLLAVIAGPYTRIVRVHDGIPLGLFSRRSMGRILEREADELFEITAQGFDLYRKLFGQPYAFGKYDQLFVPEFNAGAMENVAAVTSMTASCSGSRPPSRSAWSERRWCSTSSPTCGSATW
jgi:aminopeptidase N